MQRAATHRGQKRRAGELRDYDAAVAAVHARMRCLLDALDDDPALAGVLEQFRTGRAGIEQNMGTVQALMRPPADPFHERLAAAYPQIYRFLPRLIEALELEAIDSARPVLEAYHALGEWLAGKPRTTRRPDTEVTLEVVTPSWQPHVHDRDAGTIDRAGYASCVPGQLRARLRRRDIYAPHSTRWGDPPPNCSPGKPGPTSATPSARTWRSSPNRPPLSASSRRPWTRRGGAPPPGTRAIPTCAWNTATAVTRLCSRPWMPTPSPPRWSPCAPTSRRCCRRWRSPTCPWKCTAGPGSPANTPT